MDRLTVRRRHVHRRRRRSSTCTTANDPEQVLSDKGQLWAFQVTATDDGSVDPFDPFNDANDYLEIGLGDDWSGRFIHVPTDIARGLTGERRRPLSRTGRTRTTCSSSSESRTSPTTRTALERCTSPIPERRGWPRADTTGRLVRLGAGGTNSNGRIFKMVLNERDPRIVDSFSIVLDADTIPAPRADRCATPTTSTSGTAASWSRRIRRTTPRCGDTTWQRGRGRTSRRQPSRLLRRAASLRSPTGSGRVVGAGRPVAHQQDRGHGDADLCHANLRSATPVQGTQGGRTATADADPR